MTTPDIDIVTKFVKARLRFTLFPWQIEFLNRVLYPSWQRPILDWDQVICDVVRFGGGRASGRTTALAILLAVDNGLPDWWSRRLSWPFDHWHTRQADTLLWDRAGHYREEWLDWTKGEVTERG